jgi:hypothetical protein
MSRWVLIIALVLWLWLALLALVIGVEKAHAGFDHPLRHAPLERRAAEAAIPGRHCSKLANPVECEGQTSPSSEHRSPPNLYADHSCHWRHIMYLYHHGATGKPSSLRGYTGCRLWSRDAAYHNALRRLGLDDDLQEFIEALPDILQSTTIGAL